MLCLSSGASRQKSNLQRAAESVLRACTTSAHALAGGVARPEGGGTLWGDAVGGLSVSSMGFAMVEDTVYGSLKGCINVTDATWVS